MKNKISFILVDDEIKAHTYFDFLIYKYENFNCVGYFYNAQPAIDFIAKTKPDFIFLDMQMPGINGIEMLSKIEKTIPVVVISSYVGYAFNSYVYNVVDYLQKPINTYRLDICINKVLEHLNRLDAVEKLKDIENKSPNFVYASFNRIDYKVFYSDLEACISVGNYVNLIRDDGKEFTFALSLKGMLSILKNFDFVQINKSTIVSKLKVKDIKNNEIQTFNNKKYVISDFFNI
jgi:DNA-binding LytR/AlgR family response regulator